MITPEQRAHIRRLYFAEHWKIGAIAAELSFHRDAVELALEPKRFANRRFTPSATLLEPYHPFIEQTLEQYPRLRATRLFEMLAERGYTGSVYVVRRRVAKVRPASRHEAFFRLNTLPGEQAQVDWGSFGKLRIGCGVRNLSCFVMVLSWSRATFARFTLDQTLESFLRCHVAAFNALAGVPRSILYDYVPRHIIVHCRSWDTGKQIECDAHLQGLADEKRKAHEYRGRNRLNAACPNATEFLGHVALHGGHLGGTTSRLLRLLDQYGAQELNDAIATAQTRGAFAAQSVAHILDQRRRARGAPITIEAVLPDDPRIRDLVLIPHSLDRYDRLAAASTSSGGDAVVSTSEPIKEVDHD